MIKILIIDDDVDVLNSLEVFLASSSYKVFRLSSAQNLSGSLKSIKPHIIITDIFLGEQDGIEVIKQVKAFDDKIKIIAMSAGRAFGQKDFFLKIALEHGADRVLLKPINKAELRQTIEVLLK